MLLYFLVTLLLCIAEAQDWATLTIQDVTEFPELPDDKVQVPQFLPNNSLSPIVGFYDEKINLIDTIRHESFYSKERPNNNEWIRLTANDNEKLNGSCITSSCFTQIDDLLYIILDDVNQFITYEIAYPFNINDYPFNYPGYYCLVSDDQYIYAIGDRANILIIDPEDRNNPRFSTVYLPNHISNIEAFTCAMDQYQNTIYIFTNFAIFSYSIADDALSTLYSSHSDILPYNHSAWTTATGPNDLIWIQTADYLYPFSSVTNKFLHCRASTGGQEEVSLLNIDSYVLRFGGRDTSCGVDNICPYIRNITMVDATFHNKDRFQLQDYYHPSSTMQFNYSDTFSESVGFTDTTITLTSSDFSAITHSDILFSKSGSDITVSCDDDTSCADGLAIDISSDIASFVDDMNTNNDIDIRDISYSIEATSFSVDDSTSDTFVCNSFVIYPVYLQMSVQLLSAEYFYLKFDYEYLCNGCNVTEFDSNYAFSSAIEIKAAVLGINKPITMNINNGADTCEIVGGNDTSCEMYRLYDLDEVFFNGSYTVRLSSDDTFLESNEIDLKITKETTKCRQGTGYNEEINSCYLCPVNTFSFKSDLRQCQSCEALEGVSCDGSNSITVQYRYWLSGYKKSDATYLSLPNMYDEAEEDDDYVLISHICGYGQCCEEIDGCDYLESFNSGTLCSEHRDITSPMCTKCEKNDGTTYYELLSSNNCGICEHTRNMWHLLWIFAIAFLFTLYLAFVDAQPLQKTLHNWRHRKDEDGDDESIEYRDLKVSQRKSSEDNKEDDYESESDVYGSDDGEFKQRKPRKRKRNDRKMGEAEKKFKYFVADSYLGFSVLILQIFTYYFQGYAEILESQGSRAYLGPIINFFNMSFNNKVGAGNDGFCFIPRQSSLDEIAVILVFPSLMIFSLLLMWMFCLKCSVCRNIQLQLCQLETAIFEKPYISIAACRVTMIIIGLLFRVLMHLVTCTQFKSYTDPVQFYHEGTCYKATWFLSLAALIIFLLYIVSIYSKLSNQSNNERFNPTNPYFKLVAAYKNSYWYWEAIVTLRRFLLTMFVSLSFIGGGYSNLIFCVVLLIFLFAQILLKPFSHKRNNRVETFCLLSLLIAVIALNFEDIASTVFVSFFLGVVIFVPIILALVYLYQLCKRCGKYFSGDEKYYLDYHADAFENEQKLRVENAHHHAASSTEKMMTRVLKKVPTEYFEKRKGAKKARGAKDVKVNVGQTYQAPLTPDYDDDDDFGPTPVDAETPAGFQNQTETEMMNLQPPNDSDSCGLSEN